MDERGRPGAAGRWSDLGRRAVSAAVLAPVALFCIWIGGAPFAALIVAAATVLSIEWVALCGVRPSGWPGSAVPGLVVVTGLVCAADHVAIALIIMLAGTLLLWAGTRRAWLACGVPYIGLPLIALLWLRGDDSPVGRGEVLFLVIVVWASDIGAYAVGRLLRGPKLWPALSPGKTWSGALGGLLAALAVGLVWPGTVAACALAVGLGVVSQAGDLLESGIKRHFGVKDSGRLIPGHGGLLDRLDGLLAAAPALAIAMLMGWGGVG